MNLLKKNKLILLSILMLSLGCNEDEYSEYYAKTTDDWRTYTEAIEADELQLENTVLLVLKSSECSPSLAELQWWDEYRHENSDLNVQLIILEKYATTFQTFLAHEEINLPAFRDSSGILFDYSLLPGTPMKLFIDAKGEVKKIAAIGAAIDPNQDVFVEALIN